MEKSASWLSQESNSSHLPSLVVSQGPPLCELKIRTNSVSPVTSDETQLSWRTKSVQHLWTPNFCHPYPSQLTLLSMVTTGCRPLHPAGGATPASWLEESGGARLYNSSYLESWILSKGGGSCAGGPTHYCQEICLGGDIRQGHQVPLYLFIGSSSTGYLESTG